MSLASPVTAVFVDDTDDRIRYSDGWFGANNTQDATGVRGSSYNDTLHGTNGKSSFSFYFSGPSMGVYGPNMTNGTLLGLTCNCFIDYTGMQTTFQNITTTPITSGNSTAFCHGDFADGNHTLTVIGSGTNEQPFWFDQLQYTPSPSLVPTNQTFSLIDSSAFTYSPDRDSTKSWPWINEPNTDLFGNEHTTAVNGAWFTVSFNGTSISIIGNITNALATYFVDNQNSAYFPVVASNSSLLNTIGTIVEVQDLNLTNNGNEHKFNGMYIGNGTPILSVRSALIKVKQNNPRSPSSSTTIHMDGVMGLVLILLLLNIWQSRVLRLVAA